METLYMILDLNEGVRSEDILDLIIKTSEYLGVRNKLLYMNDSNYISRKLNAKSEKLFMKNIDENKYSGLTIYDDPYNEDDSYVDKDFEMTLIEIDKNLLQRANSTRYEIEKLLCKNESLNEIANIIGMNDFLLYMKNQVHLGNSMMNSRRINELMNSMPINEFRHFVSDVQHNQSQCDSLIIPGLMEHNKELFCSDIDLCKNKITFKICMLFRKSKNEILKYLSGLVSEFISKYPNASAYMDVNINTFLVQTPHELFLNCKDNFAKISDCSIRGYTRYSWLNMKQYKALSSYKNFNDLDGINVKHHKSGVFIELENRDYENYKKLKNLYRPLLIQYENINVSTSLFTHPLMLNTVIYDNEFEVYDEIYSEQEEHKKAIEYEANAYSEMPLIAKVNYKLIKQRQKMMDKKFGYNEDALLRNGTKVLRYIRRCY